MSLDMHQQQLIRCSIVLLVLLFSCLFVQAQCDGCSDATVTPGCPSPSLCGFKPIVCTNCSAGKPSSTCTSVSWCQSVQCSGMCMDGMPTNGCPDPGPCGMQPIPCKGCVAGIPAIRTSTCPNPLWCGNATFIGTPPCYKCMTGMAMPGCPDPGVCNLSTLCNNCVYGQPSASCPQPEACLKCSNCTTGVTSPGCPDPGVCGFPPLCMDCMDGMAMPTCPRPDVCASMGLSTCTTSMYFGTSSSVCVLMQRWRVSSGEQWALAIFLIALLCMLREFVAACRTMQSAHRRLKQQQRRALKQMQLQSSTGTATAGRGCDSANCSAIVDSMLYTLLVGVSYLVMLVIMTYNVAIFFTVIVSCGLAHFLLARAFSVCFERRRRDMDELVEREKLNVASVSGSVAQSSTVDRKAEPLLPAGSEVGGDHCCEGLDFDTDY